jgi:hypothetical protein
MKKEWYLSLDCLPEAVEFDGTHNITVSSCCHLNSVDFVSKNNHIVHVHILMMFRH